LQSGTPVLQLQWAAAGQQFHKAPGSLPHAQIFVPLPQSAFSPSAAKAGCTLAAATMNNDAKISLLISPSQTPHAGCFSMPRQTRARSRKLESAERSRPTNHIDHDPTMIGHGLRHFALGFMTAACMIEKCKTACETLRTKRES
jgi:hypothetical protein